MHLEAFASADKSALDRLIPPVYDDLRDLARRRRAVWRLEDTPGSTSLVHQLYVKLAENGAGRIAGGGAIAGQHYPFDPDLDICSRLHSITWDTPSISFERRRRQFLSRLSGC
jgi:hypothetical protein